MRSQTWKQTKSFFDKSNQCESELLAININDIDQFETYTFYIRMFGMSDSYYKNKLMI